MPRRLLLGPAVRIGLAIACAAPRGPAQGIPVASLAAAGRAAHGGDLECAVKLYTDVLLRNPHDRDALKGRAQVLVWSTRYADAESDYRRVLADDPIDLEAQTGLALTLLREDRFEESESRTRGILRVLPRDVESRLLLGEILLRTDRPVEAQAEFERASELEPANARARLGRSRALAAAGREAEACAVDEGTAAALSERASQHSEDVESRLALATALSRLDRPEAALAQYEIVLARSPDHLEAELGRATMEMRLGRLEAARAHVRSLLLGHPGSAEAHALEGQLHLRSQRHDEAVQAYALARELDPWNAQYRVGVANGLAARSDVEGARAVCAEALALDPYSHEVRDLMSRLDAIEVPGKFRLDLGLRFDRLTGPADDWSQETAHLAWRARPDLTIGAGIDGFQRFGEDDVQYEADFAWRFSDPWTFSGAYAYGPDAAVVAQTAVDAEIARRVGASSTAILHWRHAMYEAGVRTDIVSPGYEFPVGPHENLLLRYYFVDSSDTGDGNAGSARLELFPEGPVRTRVGIAYGSESFLSTTAAEAIRTGNVLTLFAGVEWRCSKRARLSLGYDYEDHSSSADKQGLAIGFTVEF
jgi:YaiO family outer membrane protein